MEQPQISSQEQQQLLLYQRRQALEARARGGINWFFWIGGLSVLNTFIYLIGENLTFVVGLGATQFVDGFFSAFVQQYGASTLAYVFWIALDVILSGLFIGAGFLGRKGHRWAIITGIVVYAFDALLLFFFKDWLGIAFHALALFGLFSGLKALNALRKLDQPAPISSIPVLP